MEHCVSTKTQEEIFTRGELVEVSDDMEDWSTRIFLTEIKGNIEGEIIAVCSDEERFFREGKTFNIQGWGYVRKINHIELFGKTYNTKEPQEAIKDLKPIE